jgi:hypothetical protein
MKTILGLLSLEELPPSLKLVHTHLLPDRGSYRLQRQFEKKGVAAKIDYEKYFSEFNRAFFVRNYLKCCSYLRFLPAQLPKRRVLDIGGGAGPFSLAAVHHDALIESTILDKSQAQIGVALALSRLIGLNHIFAHRRLDIFNTEINPQLTRLFSYWTCENTQELDARPNSRQTIFGHLSIVIDYPDIVAAEADKALKLGGRVTNLLIAEQRVCPRLEDIIGQPKISYGGVCLEFAS